jgi:hypothetical protein
MADVWKVARTVAKLAEGEIVFIGGTATYFARPASPPSRSFS